MSKRRRLSPITRILLVFVGWVLVAIGIAGLVLPGIQGILTILLGLAVLSVASRTIHRLLRALLHRWPWLWEKIERFRAKVHDKLARD